MSGFFVFITLAVPGLVAIGGIFTVKLLNQRERDRLRVTYNLNFPAELDPDRVVAFLRAVSRSMSGSAINLTASQTMVFELIATDSGITHRMKVPYSKADDIIPQLRALAPGVTATPVELPQVFDLTYSVEIGESNKSRPLSIPNSADVAASILASVQPLKPGESVIIQWVVTPAPMKSLPNDGTRSDQFSLGSLLLSGVSKDEIKERRDKLSEPNLMGVLRVGSAATTKARAMHLVDRVRTSFKATQTPHNRWINRHAPMDQLIDRTKRAASLTLWPAQLSTSELAALAGWPLGSPNVSGLPQGTARQLPVTAAVPTGEIIIGHSTYPGQERSVGIGFDQALMHTHVFGKTGTGKSVLLANMARHIMEAGHGLVVMETEGNLFESVVDYIPRNRVDDVIVLDLADSQHPVGFNVLDQGDPEATIDSIIELFDHLYGAGLWSDEYITNGLKTLAEAGNLSFIDLLPLLNPQSKEEVRWADDVARQVRDPELRRWWAQHDNRSKLEQQKRADPMLTRIRKLAARKQLRYVFGQKTSSFQMSDVFAQNKILLINLKGISSGTSKLVGTLMMNSIWRATKTVRKERPTYLMLDEFGDFMNLPIDTENMLAQARKHNVGLVLAHQHMSQLKPEVRDGVITNARNKITLAASPDDAKLLLKGMNSRLTITDITNLRAYEGIADVMTPTGNSGPFSIGTKPPARPSGAGSAAVARSRATYGRSVADVVADMYRHETGRSDDSERPAETGDGWD